jgi:hypothetical protein
VESLIVPSSIQRIRSFLVEMCGMKVKPWAGTEETLGALHATLAARQGCDIFWSSLRVLLETLASDLKARKAAAPGTLVDNEVLDGERYATLIDEIRAALARQTSETLGSSFRRLAAALSAPALGLLLLLGGAATVGCSHEPLNRSSQTHDAATSDLRDAIGAQPETKADSSIYLQFPDTKPASPDVASAPDRSLPRDAVSTGPDGGAVTIQDIMDSCNIPVDQQGMILGCLGAMDSSWRDGIASALAGQDCNSVTDVLECRPGEVCTAMQQLSRTFDPSNLSRLCAPVLVYLGVRFI